MAVNGHKRTFSVINGRKRTERDSVPPDCCTFALGMRTRDGRQEPKNSLFLCGIGESVIFANLICSLLSSCSQEDDILIGVSQCSEDIWRWQARLSLLSLPFLPKVGCPTALQASGSEGNPTRYV